MKKMNIVRKARKKQGIKLKEMAEYLQMPKLIYIYYEYGCGVQEMHYDSLVDLCEKLKIDHHIF